MRKLFASKKAKRKPGDYKVPVPMVGGIHNAKLTQEQLDAILTNNKNGLKGQQQQQLRKPSSSVSTETRTSRQQQHRDEQESNGPNKSERPARPISSPPILVMPKPRRPLRQADSVLRSQEFDKTQIESSSESEYDDQQLHEYLQELEQQQQGDYDEIDGMEDHQHPDLMMDIQRVMVLWPENWTELSTAARVETTQPQETVAATVPLLSNKLQRQQLLAAPEEPHELRFEEITDLDNNDPPSHSSHTSYNPPAVAVVAAPVPIPPATLMSDEQQRVLSVTSSSEDSNLQYDSARQSPLASVSSDQTPDHAAMDLLKKQLSQVSEKQAPPSATMMSNALLVVDDDDESDVADDGPEPKLTTAAAVTNIHNTISSSMYDQPRQQPQHQQPPSDTSTPKLVQKTNLVSPAKNGIIATDSSTGTSSNTVSPLLHAKTTSTGALAVPETVSVTAGVTEAKGTAPATQQQQQLFHKRSSQCDHHHHDDTNKDNDIKDINNNTNTSNRQSEQQQQQQMSQEQQQQQLRFSMTLEALRRQVEFIHQQQRLERQQWEKRELERREREEHMLNKINETQIQLQQALFTMTTTTAAAAPTNAPTTLTTNNNNNLENSSHHNDSMMRSPRLRQQLQTQQYERSRKGKDTRDENGALFPEQQQQQKQQDPSSSTTTPITPSWDTKRQQQHPRSTIRVRSKSSETPRSKTWNNRGGDNNESWKRNSGADNGILSQNAGHQHQSYQQLYHSETTFVDPISRKAQFYSSQRQSQGEYVSNSNNNSDTGGQKQQRSSASSSSRNTSRQQQRHLRIHNNDSISDDGGSSSFDEEDEEEDPNFGIFGSGVGGRRSQAGSTSSMPVYGKDSVENSPHGSNASAKSDGKLKKSISNNHHRRASRQRSRSYSAPESPQEGAGGYHSAIEEDIDDHYMDYYHRHHRQHSQQRHQRRPSSPDQQQQRQNRWSRPPSFSSRNKKRHDSSPPLVYDPPPRLSRHLAAAAAAATFHPSSTHHNRRRRDTQRMMDMLDEDLYFFGGMPPPPPPPPPHRLPRGMHHHHHHPPHPPPGSGMVAPYPEDWPMPPAPNGWPPSSLYRVGGPPSFSSTATDTYQEPVNMMEGAVPGPVPPPPPGQPGLFRQFSGLGAVDSSGSNGGGGPPSNQQQTFPPASLRHQARMHPAAAAAMYQPMDGPPSMGFR